MIARLLFQKVYKTMQFLVMNSRVYRQHTYNKFMSLLHLKKGSTEKKTPGERMRKGYRFERLRSSKIDLGEFQFNDIMI